MHVVDCCFLENAGRACYGVSLVLGWEIQNRKFGKLPTSSNVYTSYLYPICQDTGRRKHDPQDDFVLSLVLLRQTPPILKV